MLKTEGFDDCFTTKLGASYWAVHFANVKGILGFGEIKMLRNNVFKNS